MSLHPKKPPAKPYQRRLRVEQLEDRRMLAVFSVDNLNNAGVGSLRDAIDQANSNPGPDDIDFLLSGQINLLSQLPTITDALIINGGNQITIDAGDGTDNTFNTGDGFRILNVDDGDNNNEISAAINGLTLTGGDTASTGGGIRNLENLTVTNSIIIGNATRINGGGITSALGTLKVISSTISGNATRFGQGAGGGIRNFGTAHISNTTLSTNSARDGGAIENSGTLTILNSTLSGNVATSAGGAIRTHSSGSSSSITSSTVVGNNAGYRGGGIYNDFSSVTIANTIVSGNTAVQSGPDLGGLGNFTGTYALVGNGTGQFGISDGSNGNQVGTNGSPLDPLLGALADNGGPTETHALLAGSPAIDAGDLSFDPNTFTPPLNTDQRGVGFDRVENDHVDIGAFEVQVAVPILADFDVDGDIDGADFLAWQRGFDTQAPNATPADGDADGDQDVDAADLGVWASQFGQPAPLVATVASSQSLASAVPREVAFFSSELAGIADLAGLHQRKNQAAQLVDLVFESEANEVMIPASLRAPRPASIHFANNAQDSLKPPAAKALKTATQESTDFLQALDVALDEEFDELHFSI